MKSSLETASYGPASSGLASPSKKLASQNGLQRTCRVRAADDQIGLALQNKRPLVRLLDSKILSIHGVQRRKSGWGHGIAYWTQNREFAHFQNENMLDIRITRGWLNLMRREPLDRRITLRPRPSDWIMFKITNRRDVDVAFKLVKLALRNNRSVQT